MPLCVYDIASDGSATLVRDDAALTGAGVYRWLHFDLSDPDLEPWATRHISELPAAALLQTQTRPRCDRAEGGLILNLRGINLNQDGPADQMVSVRMWASAHTIVTVRLRRVFALEDMRLECEAGRAPVSVAGFVQGLAERLSTRVQTVVFDLADRVEQIEETQSDVSTPLPTDMGELRRQAIRLHRYLGPQKDALLRLSDALVRGDLPEGESAAMREVANQTILHVEELESLRGRLNALQDQHDSHLSDAQGRHGYVLSIVAAVFLPLGFLTGLFGVNVAGMPGVAWSGAFAALSAAMVLMGLLVLAILRWLRWV